MCFFFFSKSFFIHSFILVHSFTKYVLDHIQNIGNDRNVQSVPEGKKNRNRNSGPLLLPPPPPPPTMETWNIQSSIWSENNLFFFTENLIWSSAAVTKNHTLKAHVSHCLLYKKKTVWRTRPMHQHVNFPVTAGPSQKRFSLHGLQTSNYCLHVFKTQYNSTHDPSEPNLGHTVLFTMNYMHNKVQNCTWCGFFCVHWHIKWI